MDRYAAAFSERLENSLNVHGNFNSKTSNRIDLSTVVGRVGIDSAVHIDSVAPSSIDFLDGGTDIKEEGAMTIVRALASIREVPLEVDVGHTESVLESPTERTIGHVLEALKIIPINTLRNSTSPIILVINNRLTLLDDFPDLLADSNEIVDADITIINTRRESGSLDAFETSVDGVLLLNSGKLRKSQSDSGGAENILRNCECNAGNSNNSKKHTHPAQKIDKERPSN